MCGGLYWQFLLVLIDDPSSHCPSGLYTKRQVRKEREASSAIQRFRLCRTKANAEEWQCERASGSVVGSPGGAPPSRARTLSGTSFECCMVNFPREDQAPVLCGAWWRILRLLSNHPCVSVRSAHVSKLSSYSASWCF